MNGSLLFVSRVFLEFSLLLGHNNSYATNSLNVLSYFVQNLKINKLADSYTNQSSHYFRENFFDYVIALLRCRSLAGSPSVLADHCVHTERRVHLSYCSYSKFSHHQHNGCV